MRSKLTIETFKKELFPIKDKLFRLAHRLLNNREEAEDTVQEIYLKVWEMGDRFMKYDSSEAVLMTMTRNRCLDKLKTKKNKASELDGARNKINDQNALEKMETEDLAEKAINLMNMLPEQQKTILHLRDVEGMSFEEIEKITGFDGNYIRVNLSRARKKIRESLQKTLSYEIG